MRRAPASLLLIASLAAGCGGGGDDDYAGQPAAQLTVTVRPDGPGTAARTRTVVCESLDDEPCRGLPDSLRPVPREAVCTSIFGGPAVATVRGEIGARPVEARFDLRNGCEIARWERNEPLLGPAPLEG